MMKRLYNIVTKPYTRKERGLCMKFVECSGASSVSLTMKVLDHNEHDDLNYVSYCVLGSGLFKFVFIHRSGHHLFAE